MESAYEYLRLAFNVMSELIQPSVLNSKEELGDLFQREGELFLKLDMPDHALSAMSHAVELRMNARNNSNNLNTRAKLCESYDACARAAAGIGNQELAESCFTKALELAEALEDDEPEERFEKLYLKVHRHAAETEINCEDVTEAETTAETVRRLLAQAKLAQEGNAMEEAAKYYLQARDLALDDATTEPSTEKSRLMARVLEARGCFLALTSDPEAAEELQNNVDLCMAIFNSTGLADDYSELGAAYIAQAFLPEKREALYEAKEIFETLVQKFPDETAYRVRYDMVRDVLK